MIIPFVLLLAISIALTIAVVVLRRRLAGRMAIDTGQTAIPVDEVSILETLLNDSAQVAPVGLVVLDESGSPVFENQIAQSLSKASGGDAMLGLRLRSFLGDAAGAADNLLQEVEVFSPSRRIISLASHPLQSPDGRIGTAVFMEDLTTASQVDSMRSDFIANASHELKTPLGALRLLAEALAATEDPGVQADLGRSIQAESARMTRIVEDILDLASLEGDQQEAEIVEVCDVVEAAVAQTALLANTSGVAVDHVCRPVSVSGDRQQLVSAIANLIENAINYTAVKGSSTLPVEIRVGPVNGRARISITDHGIGIPARHRERIFERFYRVDRGRSRATGGTGLGLSIVRHTVTNHRGTISVESVPGEGSVFVVDLPAAGN